MNCERCSNGTESNLMNDMCGIEIGNTQCSLDDQASSDFAPKGHDKPAWGNAPGSRFRFFSLALKGRNTPRIVCAALSGLVGLLAILTQGVALGWFVVAPSGRHRTGSGQRSLFCALAILLFPV